MRAARGSTWARPKALRPSRASHLLARLLELERRPLIEVHLVERGPLSISHGHVGCLKARAFPPPVRAHPGRLALGPHARSVLALTLTR